jgi:scyllo-inositol 2-dehydrogenase (NAD+)
MNTKLNIGVIGLGRLGSLYARYFANRISNVRLVALADVAPDVAAAQADALGVSRYFTKYEELLSLKDINAVVITAPTSAHKDIAIEANRYGKAIFCEKPLSLSLADADSVMEAIGRTGGFFQMGFMRRFDSGYAGAKKKIEAGAIGTPIVFKSSSRDPFRPSLEYADPKHSGGLIIDCGIHDFDLARWFMGDIASVHSIGGTLAYPEMKEIGDIDNAIVSLSFGNGCIGTVDLSRSGVYGYDIRTEVLGTTGTLKIGYLRHTPVTILTKQGVTHDTVPYFMERFEQAYVNQLQDFVDNVLNGKAPSISCADGVAALEVSIAATVSMTESRPVQVSRNSKKHVH